MTVPLLTSYWTAVHNYNQARTTDETPAFVPVSISVGSPRFMPSAGIPKIGALAPYGLMKIKSDDEFYAHYRMRLEQSGVDGLQWEFDRIFETYQRPLVLLCFERNPADCHRRFFATWWKDKTGQEIPEAYGLAEQDIKAVLGAA
jgi:hypothetical protein